MAEANGSEKDPKQVLKSYKNQDFIKSHDARLIRVICEFIEPESRLRDQEVENTIVFFGSARNFPLATTEKNLQKIEKQIKEEKNPADSLLKDLIRAKKKVKMSQYNEVAYQLSKKLTTWSLSLPEAKKRFYLCSGGGPGIMEATNKGAHEAGGKSIGLNISLPTKGELPNSYQTPDISFEFHYFFVRKFWFLFMAKALVAFPGGFGTFDELFEVLTLLQTRKITKPIPVVLFGKEYWNDVLNLPALVEWGTIDEKDLDLLTVFDDVDEAFEFLKKELTEKFLSP